MASPDPVRPKSPWGEPPYPKVKSRSPFINYERRLFLKALTGGLLAVIVALFLLWTGTHALQLKWTLTLFITLLWIGFGIAVRTSVVRPLQTLSNMQAALREGDFSIRARGASFEDSMGELMMEVNALAESLRQERLGALEATALLERVMEEIEVAVLAFDQDHCLRLLNRAGEKLLGRLSERVLGATAQELGLEEILQGEAARTIDHDFPGATGRFAIRRGSFRQGGIPHQLVVIADLSRALREEERQAWQRLVRVLGHELNNSLAPIKSIAESLSSLLRKDPRPSDWEDDLRRGLRIINERSEALARFMRDYSRLARLPHPRREQIDIASLVKRIAQLEDRMPIAVEAGPELRIQADPDQLEQLLINLLRNAVDASLETNGSVAVGWSKNGNNLHLWVRDEGPGVSNAGNLFVPFFTTKPGGSGIGLALSRQIAEAHGGSLTLENRQDTRGSVAKLKLPL
jgi:nitrogen fixation/metabolism regulation signal transduction histidine kinase